MGKLRSPRSSLKAAIGYLFPTSCYARRLQNSKTGAGAGAESGAAAAAAAVAGVGAGVRREVELNTKYKVIDTEHAPNGVCSALSSVTVLCPEISEIIEEERGLVYKLLKWSGGGENSH